MFNWLRDHGVIERNLVLMGVLTLITVAIGGLVQIVPLFTMETTIEPLVQLITSGVFERHPDLQAGLDEVVALGR